MADRFVYKESFFYGYVLAMTKAKVEKLLEKDMHTFYRNGQLPKSDGSVREISKLQRDSELYQIQSRLYQRLFSHIDLPASTKGFVPQKSYKDYLYEHIGHHYFMHLDIKDFFPSIDVTMLAKSLEKIITISDNSTRIYIINAICHFCTLNGILPQGAVTSPSLANLVFRNIDRRIEKYCEHFNISYSRYADDMLFSSEDYNFGERKNVYKMIHHILWENNFRINTRKTKLMEGQYISNGISMDKIIKFSKKRVKTVSFFYYCFQKYQKTVDDHNYCSFIRFIDHEQALINANDSNMANAIELQNTMGPWERRFFNKDVLLNFLGGCRSHYIDWLSLQDEINYVHLSAQVKKIECMMDYFNLLDPQRV